MSWPLRKARATLSKILRHRCARVISHGHIVHCETLNIAYGGLRLCELHTQRGKHEKGYDKATFKNHSDNQNFKFHNGPRSSRSIK